MRKGLNHRFHDLPLVDEATGIALSMLILYWLALSAVIGIGIAVSIFAGIIAKAFPLLGVQYQTITDAIIFSETTDKIALFVFWTSAVATAIVGVFLALDYLTNAVDTVLRKVGILGGN
ncbi:hypothetical protein [Haloferax sp. ATB1]|uniref:hypothetical protein n=1 Tax=Haloferax sp. ATB1 TaxID=1508454 RepID=UPI0005B1EAF6|nr:hypothetical protein [Haloferax sp. ATB1]